MMMICYTDVHLLENKNVLQHDMYSVLANILSQKVYTNGVCHKRKKNHDKIHEVKNCSNGNTTGVNWMSNDM